MTDKEIVERAKEAEKRTFFGELVHSPISKGVNSAFGIGFVEGMVEYRNSLQDEPVNEELEEALAREWQGYNDRGAATVDALEDNTQELAFAKGFYRGAKWQKEEMMANAIETKVHIDAGNYPYIPQIELYDYDKDIPLAKEGDKYKIILIKEDRL